MQWEPIYAVFNTMYFSSKSHTVGEIHHFCNAAFYTQSSNIMPRPTLFATDAILATNKIHQWILTV